jgi:hypothetical protein
MGSGSDTEVEWLCSSIYSVMGFHYEVQSCRRFLRMPLVLAEPSYVSELRQGAAFRALRRLGMLARLNRVIEEALDSVLSGKFLPSCVANWLALSCISLNVLLCCGSPWARRVSQARLRNQ